MSNYIANNFFDFGHELINQFDIKRWTHHGRDEHNAHGQQYTSLGPEALGMYTVDLKRYLAHNALNTLITIQYLFGNKFEVQRHSYFYRIL